jgi:hypothetical protein
VRGAGPVVLEELDRLVDDVDRQVVAVLVGAGRVDVVVVVHQLRRVLVGLGVEEPVVAVEAALQRPAVVGAGGPGLGEGRDVPLAGEVVAVPVRPQHLGHRPGRPGDLAAVAGEAAVEVGEAADAHVVVVPSGQQRGPGGGAHGRRVEAGVAQTIGREGVDRRGVDLGPVAPEVGEPDVVEEDHEHVRGPARDGLQLRGPVRLRLADRGADGPLEARLHGGKLDVVTIPSVSKPFPVRARRPASAGARELVVQVIRDTGAAAVERARGPAAPGPGIVGLIPTAPARRVATRLDRFLVDHAGGWRARRHGRG